MCDFDKEDAGDFIVNGVSADQGKYVDFDGTMHLRTKYDLQMSVPTALGGGYISESEEIDFLKYKKVEVVE